MIFQEYYRLFALIAIFGINVYATSGLSDEIDIDERFSIQPLLLIKEDSKFSLVTINQLKPNGDINLMKGQNLVLVCPGGGNYLAMTKEDRVENLKGKRETEKLLQPGSFTTKQIQEAKCLLPDVSTAVDKKQGCANGLGKLFEVGFQAHGWIKLYSLCIDYKNFVTLYTVHSVENHKKIQSPHTFNVIEQETDLLRTSNQINIFRAMFGKTRNRYSNEHRLLKRADLVPKIDFYFPAWQEATAIYENTFAQWQSINKGNWARIEAIIPELSFQMKSKLSVTTLVYGVLELPDETGNLKKMYEDYKANRIPVPKHSIKIIYEPISMKGIALVTLNNRYVWDYTDELLCTDICMQNGWISPQNGSSLFETKDVSQGVTICCDIQKLKEKVSYVPDDIKVTGVLRLTLQQQYALEKIVKQ